LIVVVNRVIWVFRKEKRDGKETMGRVLVEVKSAEQKNDLQIHQLSGYKTI